MNRDASARTQALDPHSSFIVQAPAGSGKTGLLVYRMLTLLAIVEQPQQVLAITFTRKATAELRERVLELIRRASNKESGHDAFDQQGLDLAWVVIQRDRELDWNLLDSPHQLQILTIDAFCARLTTSMPWLSRLGDRPRTTDKAEKHYAAAVEQLLSELLQGDSKLTRCLQLVMLEMDFDYTRARRLFVSMLAKRDQWLRHILSNDLSALRSSLEYAWQTVCSEQLAELSELFSSAQLNEIVEMAKFAAGNIAHKEGVDSPLAAFESFESSVRLLGLEQWKALRFFLFGRGDSLRKQINIRVGFPPKHPRIEDLKSLLADFEGNDRLRDALIETDFIPRLQFTNADWEYLLALEEVLKALAGLLQLQFRVAGECDHSEVSQRANLALQELDNPTDLALRMDYQLQHILVDEFQDTSHSQIELLKRLTAGWSAEQANTLFLVGDPMQSIYRFRESDVSLFLRVAENAHTQVFKNIQIQSLTLTENFRSSGNLVAWFNQIFEPSFPSDNNVLSGAIKYAPATSNRPDSRDHLAAYLADDKHSETIITINAVKKSLNELPDAAARVALLVRGRSQLSSLIPALQAEGIAYQGVGIQPLNQQAAVIDIIALCKALCREDDRVAWLALLRGPWCGLRLAELSQVAGNSQTTVWQQLRSTKFAEDLPSDSEHRIQRFMRVMENALAQRQQISLASLTRWTWQALGGNETLFGASVRDIDTVIGLIQDLQSGGDLASLAELDQSVESLYAEPSGDTEARLIVSTMHRAKGLQFHTVILPGLSRSPGANNKELMMWAEHLPSSGEFQLLLAPQRLEDEPGSHYSYLRALDKKRATNESVRLMYVACTRAEQKLILIGELGENEQTGDLKKPNSNTLLAGIWKAAEIGFVRGMLTLEDSIDVLTSTADDEEIELDQTLQRLPASYRVDQGESINWQAAAQLIASDPQTDEPALEFDWSSEVATAVGTVMHDWLQFNQSLIKRIELGAELRAQWRADLRALGVPAAKLSYGVERLSSALQNIQNDPAIDFLFADYPEQRNEYALASNQGGMVKHYRIDRTFVDQENTRWIVDYKTTSTRSSDIDRFVDQQIEQRHRSQLEQYGALMSQLDHRPIKLAIYFPMLGKLRSWDYQP